MVGLTPTSGPAVRLTKVTKRFGPNTVLRDVSLDLHAGEVHALVGQNGAGKSTLGKIIGGVYRPDAGTLEVAGHVTRGWSTRQALGHGVATIQQELSLVPDRTVAENVFLGIEPARLGVLTGGLEQRFEALEQRWGLGLAPTARVGDLRLADQQKVEIMRALARDARVIVMDEPTSSLTANEVERLHAVIASLRDEGRLVVYVTHFLSAVLGVCDRLTILRDGELVRTGPTDGESAESIVQSMLGRATDVSFVAPEPLVSAEASPRLELRNVSAGTVVRDVSLRVRPGEIVGLAGLVGSGRTEVARVVFGADRLEGGEILVDGEPLPARSPLRSIRRGIAFIPEDRKSQGLVMTQDVQRNVGLLAASRLRRRGAVSDRAERALAAKMIDELQITPDEPGHAVVDLSGGNQQKVLFGKWMTISPRVVLLDEPTRGVDVGARVHIYRLIAQLAARGAAVLLISSELEEVLGLSHRVYLMRDGATVGEVDPATTTADDVLFALFDIARTTDRTLNKDPL